MPNTEAGSSDLPIWRSPLKDLYKSGLDADDRVMILVAEVDVFARTDGTTTRTGEYRSAAAELEGKAEDLIPDNRRS